VTNREPAAPAVTVVVPTRDRPATLKRCLRAIAAQSIPVELIVADDGSAARHAVASAAADAGAKLVESGGSGPAAARNAGARAASGAIVCFTDDDCEPEPAWAAELAAAAAEAGAAAGETINADERDRWATASQLLTSEVQSGSLDPATGRLGFAPTSCLAVRAEVAAMLPFDERFPSAAGEDRDWCARAAAAGFAPLYVPAARVLHRQQLGPAGFLRQQYRYGHGAAAFRRGGGMLAGRGERRRLLAAAFRQGVTVGALAVLAQMAVAAGYARGTISARGAAHPEDPQPSP
jgi:GT2 family glycosyltransferase